MFGRRLSVSAPKMRCKCASFSHTSHTRTFCTALGSLSTVYSVVLLCGLPRGGGSLLVTSLSLSPCPVLPLSPLKDAFLPGSKRTYIIQYTQAQHILHTREGLFITFLFCTLDEISGQLSPRTSSSANEYQSFAQNGRGGTSTELIPACSRCYSGKGILYDVPTSQRTAQIAILPPPPPNIPTTIS